MVRLLIQDKEDARGRDEFKDIIQRRAAAGCVTPSFITGGGEMVPRSEEHIGFFVTLLSDVRRFLEWIMINLL
jgi:hypothetical protein